MCRWESIERAEQTPPGWNISNADISFSIPFSWKTRSTATAERKETKNKTKQKTTLIADHETTDDISRDNKRLAAAAVDWKQTSDPSYPGTDYKGNAINNKDELIHHRNYRQLNPGNSYPYNTRPTIGTGQTVGFIGLALAGWRAADGRTFETD